MTVFEAIVEMRKSMGYLTTYTAYNVILDAAMACEDWAKRAGEAEAKLDTIRKILEAQILGCSSAEPHKSYSPKMKIDTITNVLAKE